MKKLIVILICVAVIFCVLIIKVELKENQLPFNQLGTSWCTEDGQVSFSVPQKKYDPIIGEMYLNGKETAIQLFVGGFDWTTDVTYRLYNYGEVVYPDEFWHPKKIRKDEFVVVVEDSDYFEEGEVLTFYKVK